MFLRRRRTQSDFQAEIRAHLEAETDALRGQGLSEAEAWTKARRAFGNVGVAEEHFYESGRWLAWDHVVRDVRYALRTLRKTPGLVALVVISLGLGIGVNTTIFSLFNAALLKGPTARDPERLVQIEPGNSDQISYLNYRDLGHLPGVADLAISTRATLNLTTGDTLQSLTALQVSANYFDLLGVNAAQGRIFTTRDAPEQSPRLAILEHGFARRLFPGDAEVVGRILRLNSEPFTVVGILPEGYRSGVGFFAPDIYVPISPVVSGPLGAAPRSRNRTCCRPPLPRSVARVVLLRYRANVAANGRALRECPLRECLVDDDHRRRADPIRRLELAALTQGDPHRLEVSGTNVSSPDGHAPVIAPIAQLGP